MRGQGVTNDRIHRVVARNDVRAQLNVSPARAS
jgi:hypothetical protein